MDNLIKHLAYDLSEPKSKAQRILLKKLKTLKKDYLIEDSCKNPQEMKKMALLIDSDYEDIYSVLNDEKMKNQVIANFVGALCAGYAEYESAKFANPISDVQKTALFDAHWGLVMLYLRRCDKDTVMKCAKQMPNGDGAIRLLYSFRDANPGEKESIKDSDFLRENLNLLTDTIISCKNIICSTSTVENYLSPSKFRSIKKDLEVTERISLKLKEREGGVLLNKATVPPSKSDIYSFTANKLMVNVIDEYYLMGLDVLRIFRSVNLSKNEVRRILKESFHLYELRNPNCKYTKTEQEEAIDLSIRQVVKYSVIKKTEELYKSKIKPKSESEELRVAKKRIRRLEEENNSLLRKLSKPREVKDNSKEFMAEISGLRKELREKTLQIQNLTREIQDIKSIIEVEEVETAETSSHVEEFKEYLQTHKVMVWGLRDGDEAKLSSEFPELRFVSSDSRLSRTQIANYDVVIMGTSYTNHGSFWHTRDFLKNANIPFAYMAKYDHSLESLANAWYKAVAS